MFWCLILNVGLVVQISTLAGCWYQMVIGCWVTGVGVGVGGCSLVVPLYQDKFLSFQYSTYCLMLTTDR